MRIRQVTTIALSSLGLLLIVGQPAHAAPTPPAPLPVHALKTTPSFLEKPTGLTAPTSAATPGLAGLDPTQLEQYVKALSALTIDADYHADPNAPAVNLGAATLEKGADIHLLSSVKKADGQDEATLNYLELDAKGVKLGPSIDVGPIHTGPLINLQKVTLDSKGQISIKLNSWIPTITITKVEHEANGDTVLHASNWWVPDVTIKKNGDVQTTIGIGPFKFTKTLAHLNFDISPVVANWPPKADVALGMVGALEGLTQVKGDSAAGKMINQLAGSVNWTVAASAHDPKLSMAGATTDATINLAASGSEHLANGELKSTGTGNKIHVDVALAGTTVDNAKAAIALHDAKASLDGSYNLDLPLADAKHMVVSFDGHADVSGNGTSAKLTLPNGAHVAVGTFALSDSGDVKFTKSATGNQFALNHDNYSASVTGPIHVDGLTGPVKSVDLTGKLSSTGTLGPISSTAPTSLSLKGNLDGSEQTTSDTAVTLPDGTKTTLKKGSQVNVALGDLEAGITGAGTPAQQTTAKVQGTVGVAASLGDTKVTKNGETIDVASAQLNAQVTTDATLVGSKVTGTADATVLAHAQLGNSNLDVAGKSTSITLGGQTITLPFDNAKVDLKSGQIDASAKAHLALDGSTVSGTGTGSLSTNGTIGDSKITADGKTIDLPSGTVGAQVNGQVAIGPGGVTGTATGSATAHENVGDLKLGPLDLPQSAIDASVRGQVGLGPKGLSANGQATAAVKTTQRGTVDFGLGTPGNGVQADTTIAAGTGASVSATFNHGSGASTTAITGQANVNLGAGTAINAETGKLQATANTTANVGITSPFAATVGPGSKVTIDPTKTSATIVTKLGLSAGTRIAYNQPGQVTSFTLENSQSYLQFSTPITLDATGHPSLKEIDNVSIVLVAGPSQVMVLGNGITIPAGNQLVVKGKVVFGANGIQVTGSATVGVNLTGTPVSFTINF